MLIKNIKLSINRFTHNVLKIHNGKKGPVGFNGRYMTARCSFCGKKVLKNHHGRWILRVIR